MRKSIRGAASAIACVASAVAIHAFGCNRAPEDSRKLRGVDAARLADRLPAQVDRQALIFKGRAASASRTWQQLQLPVLPTPLPCLDSNR